MQGLTGKILLFGYDTQRRPALYLLPSRQNTEEGHRQVEFTVFMLERCTDLMPPGVECVQLLFACVVLALTWALCCRTLALMIDYADKAKNPSLSQARKVGSALPDAVLYSCIDPCAQVLGIIQDHYPERLGRALILNIPWLLKAFFSLITPFIDPVGHLPFL
jgi:hypothetical protein